MRMNGDEEREINTPTEKGQQVSYDSKVNGLKKIKIKYSH